MCAVKPNVYKTWSGTKVEMWNWLEKEIGKSKELANTWLIYFKNWLNNSKHTVKDFFVYLHTTLSKLEKEHQSLVQDQIFIANMRKKRKKYKKNGRTTHPPNLKTVVLSKIIRKQSKNGRKAKLMQLFKMVYRKFCSSINFSSGELTQANLLFNLVYGMLLLRPYNAITQNKPNLKLRRLKIKPRIRRTSSNPGSVNNLLP